LARLGAITILRGIEVTADGGASPSLRPIQRVVLAALAVHAGEPVRIDTLVDWVWQDDAPASAVRTLQSHVSRLRAAVQEALPDADIERTASGYRLVARDGAVDVVAAEALASEGKQAAQEGDLEAAASTLSSALDLFGTQPLAELADVPAARPAITRVTELHRQVAVSRVEVALARANAGAVISLVEEWCRRLPLDEQWACLRMEALYDLGRQTEALAAYRELRRALVDELGVEPAPETREVEARILNHGGSRRARHLPRRSAPDSFVGRTSEVECVRSALSAHRVVTVTGEGGIGKSRLALECVDATAFVAELGAVAGGSTEDLVAAAVARQLGVADVSDGWELVAHLSRRRMLLVLDNCEHVRDSVRSLVTAISARCREVTLLCTGRAPLNTPDEHVVRLGPLGQDAALELFCDRATQFVDAIEMSLAAEVCTAADGIPLALELAAGALRLIELAELRDRLVASTPPPGEARSIERVVDTSLELLTPVELRTLRLLAAFPGGVAIDQLERLFPAADPHPTHVVSVLIDHSLLHRRVVGGRSRAAMLIPLRLRVLSATPTDERAADDERLVAWARDFAADAAVELTSPNRDKFTQMIDSERANLVAALRAAASTDTNAAAHSLADLSRYLWQRLADDDIRSVVRAVAADRTLPPLVRSRALRSVATLHDARALPFPMLEVRAIVAEGVDAAERSGDGTEAALWSAIEATTALTDKEPERARERAEEAQRLAERAPPFERGVVSLLAAYVLAHIGDVPAAAAALDAALAAFRVDGDTVAAAHTLQRAGHIAVASGDAVRGSGLLAEAQDGLKDTHPGMVLNTLNLRAWAELADGDTDGAASVMAEVDDFLAAHPELGPSAYAAEIRGQLAVYRGDFPAARREFLAGAERARETDATNLGTYLWWLGLLDVLETRPDDARSRFSEALDAFVASGKALGIAECLEGIAVSRWPTSPADRLQHVAALFAAAEHIRADIGRPRLRITATVLDPIIADVRARLGTDVDEAWATGMAWTREEAIAAARR
jgi:DNA-binding SARP family transcriptional activator